MPLAHKDRIRLHHGPYRTLPCQPGDMVVCDLFGTVRVKTFTDAPIPWPLAIRVGAYRPGGKSAVRGGDLVRAMKTESAAAISHWFGIGICLISKMRREYGIPRENPGTHTLRKTQRIKEQHKQKFIDGGKKAHELMAWPAHELALLGTLPDAKIARMIGRSLDAVSSMRKKHRIQPVHRPMKAKRWTEAEDRIIWHLKPREAEVHLPHRTAFQIAKRQSLLRGTLYKRGKLVSPPQRSAAGCSSCDSAR